MPSDFVGKLRAPWSTWFRALARRRGVRRMAAELMAEGPDGDWRSVAADDPPGLRGSASER